MLDLLRTPLKASLLGAAVTLAALLSAAGVAHAGGVSTGPAPQPSSTASPSPTPSTASPSPTPSSSPAPIKPSPPPPGMIILSGVYDPPDFNNCSIFRTFDDQFYVLDLPQSPTPDQRYLFYPGLPVNVPVWITVLPEEAASFCGGAAQVAVLEAYTLMG